MGARWYEGWRKGDGGASDSVGGGRRRWVQVVVKGFCGRRVGDDESEVGDHVGTKPVCASSWWGGLVIAVGTVVWERL